MIVSRIGQLAAEYQPGNAGNPQRAAKAKEKNDSIALSSNAKDYQAVRRAIDISPEVREDRVKEVLQKMANGAYNTSAKEAANKIFSKMDLMA